jgi:hypothetical protein
MEEIKQGKKWSTPPADYKLKSDVGALCDAAVEKFTGKDFGAFYAGFCADLGARYKKYGASTMISVKQMAILTKLEVNNWPEGVKPEARPSMGTYDKPFDDPEDAASIPF